MTSFGSALAVAQDSAAISVPILVGGTSLVVGVAMMAWALIALLRRRRRRGFSSSARDLAE